MTAHEIFKEILTHQIKGIMIHEQFADYYDFLNLHGFRTVHEKRYRDESEEFRNNKHFYIKHYGKLPVTESVSKPNIIPESWYSYTKEQLNGSIISNAVKNAFDMWVDWETKTVELYEKSYKDLNEIGDFISAEHLLKMAKCTSEELNNAKNEWLKLKMCDYDILQIIDEQD